MIPGIVIGFAIYGLVDLVRDIFLDDLDSICELEPEPEEPIIMQGVRWPNGKVRPYSRFYHKNGVYYKVYPN